METVIITGGFRFSNVDTNAISTDVAALRGAQRYANDSGIPLQECFEAWIPEPAMDRRDKKGAVRMSADEGIKVNLMSGRTALGRRLAMVAEVDLVVTISGRVHTELVVEQALELGLPVLPIPNAGGDSESLLKKYKDRIGASFASGALDLCLNHLSATITNDLKSAASAVVKLLKTAKVERCLALMPYDPVHTQLYESRIKPAIERHMIPVRLDLIPSSTSIYTSFEDAIQDCTSVVADFTTFNQNVMYELGYAHGRGIEPLIYTREPTHIPELPLYLKTLNVRPVSETSPPEKLIDEYLRAAKGKRRSHRRMPTSFDA
jgi:hypothetical protein